MESEYVFGTGIDIIEVQRVKRTIERHPNFLGRIFTVPEIRYCSSKKKPDSMYISFEQRFAAKEAVSKALGTGIGKNARFCEIEIINEESGKPTVRLSGKTGFFASSNKVSHIEISLSGLKDYAIAYAIAFMKNYRK